ncbi:MAG: FtsX-like permease family protein, partial [Bacteroidota bacterium]
SSFSPTKVIKGQISTSNSKNRLRQTMVVFQFCVSSGLIISTLVVNDQLDFLQSKELGFEEEQVLIIRRATALRDNYAPFISKIKNNASIVEVSTSQNLPGDEFSSTIFVPEQPSNYQETSLSFCHTDMNFVRTLGLELALGRDYNSTMPTDSSAYLINETAAERLGWDDPVGKKLTYAGFAEGQVIGVLKDFNFNSLHEEIEPLVIRIAERNLSNIVIRLQVGNLREQLHSIQKEWESFAPNAPFEFAFLDSEIQQLYESENRMSSIFTVFSLLAIFIACLGLFGLATFMAQRRTKEIGVRKVLGASIANLIGLLAKDFLKLVMIALIFAIPIAYYFMNQWLDNFAYAIQIQWWVFALTAIIALGIALLTISFQSVKTALANPINSLKNE